MQLILTLALCLSGAFLFGQSVFLEPLDCHGLKVSDYQAEDGQRQILHLEKEIIPGVWQQVDFVTAKTTNYSFTQLAPGTYRVTALAEAIRPGKTDRYTKTKVENHISNAITIGCIDERGEVVATDLIGQVRLTPNPVQDRLLIHFSRHPKAPVQYEIINLNGESLYEGTIRGHQAAVAVDELTNGLYFIRLYSGQTFSHSARFVVSK